jgi:hypothetical protein
MSTFINVREQVLNEIKQLDHEQLDMVLNFLHSLKCSESATADEEQIIDPLADFVGAVESGNLADKIDSDLYG